VTDPADGTPEIRLADLSKHFRDVRAVDRVSLDIGSGEFFSMLGPSGCGKTTTLRMIGGFELPTGGRIELRGRDVTTDPPDKRPVNMVFQNYALFPHLDVGENIAFGLRRKAVDKQQIRRRVAEALDLVHLAGYDRRKPNQLSGGQQQRVALARALVNRPNVLLLDEPLGALDLKLRKALQVELKRVQTEVGITFVYVTHDQEEALTMSDRIAVMNGGRVEQLGTPEELYERPRTRFVADFIGTTNLLHGVVDGFDGGTAVIRLDGGDHCRVAGVRDVVGETVDLSLRPEAIRIESRNGEARPSPEWLGGTVEQVAYLGAAVQYRVLTGGGLELSVLAAKSGSRFNRGDGVELAWEPAEALVLGDSALEGGAR
jgi:spermidine/putrescine transport system ATP-binding protein